MAGKGPSLARCLLKALASRGAPFNTTGSRVLEFRVLGLSFCMVLGFRVSGCRVSEFRVQGFRV